MPGQSPGCYALNSCGVVQVGLRKGRAWCDGPAEASSSIDVAWLTSRFLRAIGLATQVKMPASQALMARTSAA